MKVLLLGGANSIHTLRWANGLAGKGVEVHLASIHPLQDELDSAVKFYRLPYSSPAGYVLAAPCLKRLLKKIKPDLMNAHYATGYGLLARLSGFKPTLLSVWGSDVYEFPKKSLIHKKVLAKNLQFATAIGSTSKAMVQKIRETYEHPQIFVTPFGIDEQKFSPQVKNDSGGTIVIGTVKSLKKVYGIDVLMRAFSLIVQALGASCNVRLDIVGGGAELLSLQNLASELQIADKVMFRGSLIHDQVPDALAGFDIYAALSHSESFGVSILEASASGLPVVVSDADGPKEVTEDQVTGFVVPKDDAKAASEALLRLVRDRDLREKMGRAGREHVCRHYTWSRALDIMLEVYRRCVTAS